MRSLGEYKGKKVRGLDAPRFGGWEDDKKPAKETE